MHNIVGSCAKCGAPVYANSLHMSVDPPPSIYSCSCFPNQRAETSTSIRINTSDWKDLLPIAMAKS